MKGIITVPPQRGASLEEINPLDQGDVEVDTLLTGVCGTDRAIVSGLLDFARSPHGSPYLVLGHEVLGRVASSGGGSSLRPGDLVVPVVRRGCGECLNCLVGRQDFCETGKFSEIGIRGIHGGMREKFRDSERYLVKVPRNLGKKVAVLAEPLSNVVKAVEEVLQVQARSIWSCPDSTLTCRTALVVGTGPIGLLFTLLLRSYGLNVVVANRRPLGERERKIVESAGASFLNTSKESIQDFHLGVDTTGSASVVARLMGRVKPNGALILFGTGGNDHEVIAGSLVTGLVERNVLVLGSVNAPKRSYVDALSYLLTWQEEYGDLEAMITSVVPPSQGVEVVSRKGEGEIKAVISWND